MRTFALGLFFCVAVMPAAHAGTITFIVPGTSNMWLAGMPAGSDGAWVDSAPGQSPVLTAGLNFAEGDILRFFATGAVTNGPCCAFEAPDGGAFTPALYAPENGFANTTAPVNALMGVFLGPAQPDATPAPLGLDFITIGLDFAVLTPALKQVFFIGNGLTSGSTVQHFVVPIGATQLYLGTMDGFEWNNNMGEFRVDVTTPAPEPATLLLLGAGLASLRFGRKRFTTRKAPAATHQR